MSYRTVLVTEDRTLGPLLSASAAGDLAVEECTTAVEVQRALEAGRPALILVDADLVFMDVSVLLSAVAVRFLPPPPTVLLSAAPERAKQLASNAGMVKLVLPKPLEPEAAAEDLLSLLQDAPTQAMNLMEHLACGFTDPSNRCVELRAGTETLTLMLGQGYLWALLQPLFYHRYSVALEQAGLPIPEASPSDAVSLAALEERLRPPSHQLVALKTQVVLSGLSSVPLDAPLEASRTDEHIPEGLIPLEIPPLVVSLAEAFSEGALALLKHPRLRVRASQTIPEDLPILPHQGYLLMQCAEPKRVTDLLQTGVVPHRDALSGLYVLLLLGLLTTQPEVPTPFSLAGLHKKIGETENLIRRQSQAIRNLVQSLEMPGGNPYQMLGIAMGAGPEEASRAFEELLARFSPERLLPEVAQNHQRDLFFIRAKVNESFLILQSSFMDDQRVKGQAPPLEAGGGRGAPGPTSQRNRQEAEQLLNRAASLMAQEETFEALQHLRLAIFEDPSLAAARNLMARILERMGDQKSLHQAQREYLLAIDLAPDEPEYLLDAAEFFLHLGLYARCRSFLDRARRLAPGSDRIEHLFGLLKSARR